MIRPWGALKTVFGSAEQLMPGHGLACSEYGYCLWLCQQRLSTSQTVYIFQQMSSH